MVGLPEESAEARTLTPDSPVVGNVHAPAAVVLGVVEPPPAGVAVIELPLLSSNWRVPVNEPETTAPTCIGDPASVKLTQFVRTEQSVPAVEIVPDVVGEFSRKGPCITLLPFARYAIAGVTKVVALLSRNTQKTLPALSATVDGNTASYFVPPPTVYVSLILGRDGLLRSTSNALNPL